MLPLTIPQTLLGVLGVLGAGAITASHERFMSAQLIFGTN